MYPPLPIFLVQQIPKIRKNLKSSDTACSCSVSCPAICDSAWTAARQASLSITSSWSLFTLLSIESAMPPNHLTLCRPLLLLPSVFPSSSIFPRVSCWHQVAEALELQLQQQSFRWLWFPLGWTVWISLHSKRLSRVKHQFFGAQLSL